MPVPQLLSDIVALLVALAPAAALVSLVLAGMNLRVDGGQAFAMGGGFTRWMFWAVLFLTIVPLLSWFTTFGVAATIPSGAIGTAWLQSIQSDVTTFVTKFIVGRIVPTVSAFFVVRAILEATEGGNPLWSILAGMFLLGTQATYALLQSYNTNTSYATADVLDSLWTHFASVIAPIGAAFAVIGAVVNFATRRPWMRLIAVALALLCVSAIWRLVLAMEA